VHVARVENRGVAHKVLVGKLDGWRPLGRSGHRLEDNIKMIFKKWDGGMIWVDLPQNRTSDGLL